MFCIGPISNLKRQLGANLASLSVVWLELEKGAAKDPMLSGLLDQYEGVVSKETVVLRRWGSRVRSDEGLTLETSAFRISIYCLNM